MSTIVTLQFPPFPRAIALMEAVNTRSLGQISHALHDVGGEYRRNR